MEPEDKCLYAGPFFMGCDHGCYHGESTHGLGTGTKTCLAVDNTKFENRNYVVSCYNDWIKKSDVLFAWIDSTTAYGTLVEIGIARSLGKPIFLVCSNELKDTKFIEDIWFVRHSATQSIYASSALGAWSLFIKCKNNYFKGESALVTDYATDSQIKYSISNE